MTDKIAVKRGSGNVFADLGLDHPEEEKLKAQLVREIRDIIKRCKLTQTKAATLLGLRQPDVSALLAGRVHKFSLERLHVVSVVWTRSCPSWCGQSRSGDQRRRVGRALRPDLPKLSHADGSERGASRYRMKNVQRGMFASAVASTADIHQSDSQVSFVPQRRTLTPHCCAALNHFRWCSWFAARHAFG